MSVSSIQELFSKLSARTATGIDRELVKNHTKYHMPKDKVKMRRKMARKSRKANRK